MDELASAGRARIWSITSTSAWLEGPTFPLETPHPMIDRFADGRWLVVDALSGQVNARVLSPDGAVRDRFRLGFGIDHLMIDDDDRIWVGWGDQSIFRNSDWRVPGQQNAKAADAVACFTDGGTPFFLPAWPDEGAAVVDPYALSVDGAGAWSCPYMHAIEDFPLVRFMPGESTRWWRHPLKGATAIARHGHHILLAGRYGEDANRLALLALDGEGHGDQATVVACWAMPFHRPPPEQPHSWNEPTLLAGRGDTIHLVQDRNWYRWRVPAFTPL